MNHSRNNIQNWTPEERALFDAVQEIEKIGAHPLLTDCVVLAGQARHKLSEWIEAGCPGKSPNWNPPQTNLCPDCFGMGRILCGGETFACTCAAGVSVGEAMKELQPHQQRVVDELNELTEKVDKLRAFINESPIFPDLDQGERDRLVLQYNFMTGYQAVLNMRIRAFGEQV